MASKDPGEAVGEVLADVLKIVFSLVFPLLFITLCGASFVLAMGFRLPEFGLWAVIAIWALDYAKTNIWFALGLGLFALASLPLAWLALREHELRASTTIFAYVMSALIFGFLFWLRTVWSYNGSGWQVMLYGLVMFAGWQAVMIAPPAPVTNAQRIGRVIGGTAGARNDASIRMCGRSPCPAPNSAP